MMAGNDDTVGWHIREEIFKGQDRKKMGEAGFDGVLAVILDLAEGLVEEVMRY